LAKNVKRELLMPEPEPAEFRLKILLLSELL
jgi:hypothetical protein